MQKPLFMNLMDVPIMNGKVMNPPFLLFLEEFWLTPFSIILFSSPITTPLPMIPMGEDFRVMDVLVVKKETKNRYL